MTTYTLNIDTDDQGLVKKFLDVINSTKKELHIPIEMIKEEKEFDIDLEIKNLKIIDEEKGEKLGQALTFLGQGINKDFDYKKARDEYSLYSHFQQKTKKRRDR